jgi:restriction system protein
LLIDNRIAWGKSYLKKGGYITFPQRGFVQITEKGKNHSATLTVRDLENESSLFDFYKQEKGSMNVENSAQPEISSPQDLIDEGSIELKAKSKQIFSKN